MDVDGMAKSLDLPTAFRRRIRPVTDDRLRSLSHPGTPVGRGPLAMIQSATTPIL